MHPCGGLYCSRTAFKFVPKDISSHGVSVGVDIFWGHIEFHFYVLPVGFPVYEQLVPGLCVFLGAYANFSESDIVVGYLW